jgi:hypothetical protein
VQPTNYNISYYQGDDFTMTIYPKNSSGEPIGLTGTDVPFFRIADKRGPGRTSSYNGGVQIQQVSGEYAIVASVNSTIGNNISNGFVYDIGYVSSGRTVTVLTGSFSVVQRVVGP